MPGQAEMEELITQIVDLIKIFEQIVLNLNPVLSTGGRKNKFYRKKMIRVDLVTLSRRGMTGTGLVI